MNCPRCSGTFEPTTLRDFGLVHNAHRCTECRGLWIGPEKIREISMTIDQRWIEFRRVPGAEAQQMPMTCPACPGDVVMQKVVSPRDAKVVMDVCPTCKHVWLDRGEREAIEQDSLLALVRDYFGSRDDSAS